MFHFHFRYHSMARLSAAASISALALPLSALADHPTVSVDNGAAGPLTAVSAVPLPAGTVGTSIQSQLIFNDELSDAALARFSAIGEGIHSTASLHSTSLGISYGFTEDLTLGLYLPYVSRQNIREAAHGHGEESEGEDGGHRHDMESHDDAADEHGDEHEEEEGGVEVLGDARGLGDLTLFGEYRFLGDASTRSHAAVLFGVRAPTGRTDARTLDGALFETEHQPGAGAWDFLGGFAATHQWGRWSVDSNVLYTVATEGSQNTDLGNVFNYNLALSYRVTHGSGHDGSGGHADSGKAPVTMSAHRHPPVWDLIVEANGDWRDEVEIGSGVDANTGGHVLYLSAGTRLSWGHGWSASLSGGVPVVTDLNGIQSEPEARVLVGLGKSF